MLEAFTGAQRSGKTYSAVQRVLDVYLNSDRPIYTNLPLTEHFLAMRPERAPDVYFFYRSFRDVVNVAKRTRTFFRGVGFAFLDKTFFNRTGSNAFVVVDEAYEIFNFGRSKDFSPDNEKLLSYLKQHGHYGDDIIIISHDLRDVERIIRTSFQRITRVFNTKYTPIYDRFPLNNAVWPGQAVSATEAEMGGQVYESTRRWANTLPPQPVSPTESEKITISQSELSNWLSICTV